MGKSAAREGVVVVAVGDAASGGGGALDDLVRGRAPVTARAVRGRRPLDALDLGIVPNGVPAVFLTAPDGTAVRADVKDNGYEFLLPNQRRYEQRYIVWTGGDGTPHVQPIVTFAAVAGERVQGLWEVSCSPCARVSPDGRGLPCVEASRSSVKFSRRPHGAPGAHGPSAFAVRAAQMIYVARCAGLGTVPHGSGRPRPAAPRAAGRSVCRAARSPSARRRSESRPVPARRPRAAAQAPLIASRPPVASGRWLHPDPSSS